MADQVILAIGDACGPPEQNKGAKDVAKLAIDLIATFPDAVILLLGDNAYDDGTSEEYRQHFSPILGVSALKSRMRCCPGNHDYRTDGAAGYFATFDVDAAGVPAKGYYSFDLACGWHVISLNTEFEQDEDSPQLDFLRNDLQTRKHAPILSFWHRPRWGSGGHRDSDKPRWFWKELFAHKGEVVLNGHAHHYERFGQQTPDQVAHPLGMREFIVGTGGRKLSGKSKDTPNSQVTRFDRFGLLKLVLSPNQYSWEFIAIDGAVLDRGTTAINH